MAAATSNFPRIQARVNPFSVLIMPADDGNERRRYNVKVPDFHDAAAPAWFLILESQFTLHDVVNDAVKFAHAISCLPVEHIPRIHHQIIADRNYVELKKAVIDFYEQTKPELFEKLISSQSIAGRRPSAFLSEISMTAQKVGISDDLVRHKFLQSVDQRMSAVLASMKDLTLPALGKLADELQTFTPPAHQAPIYAAQPPVYPVQDNDRSRPAYRDQYQPRGRSPPRNYHGSFQPRSPSRNFDGSNRPRSDGLTPFNSDQRPKVCRWHIFFGPAANTCTPWCKWPDKGHVKNVLRPRSPSRGLDNDRQTFDRQPRQNSPGPRFQPANEQSAAENTAPGNN